MWQGFKSSLIWFTTSACLHFVPCSNAKRAGEAESGATFAARLPGGPSALLYSHLLIRGCYFARSSLPALATTKASKAWEPTAVISHLTVEIVRALGVCVCVCTFWEYLTVAWFIDRWVTVFLLFFFDNKKPAQLSLEALSSFWKGISVQLGKKNHTFCGSFFQSISLLYLCCCTPRILFWFDLGVFCFCFLNYKGSFSHWLKEWGS